MGKSNSIDSKKIWIIILSVLFVFFMFKSCSATRKNIVSKNRISLLEKQNDSLRNSINVMEAKQEGLKKSIDIQSFALDKINESKKNIKVTIKRR